MTVKKNIVLKWYYSIRFGVPKWMILACLFLYICTCMYLKAHCCDELIGKLMNVACICQLIFEQGRARARRFVGHVENLSRHFLVRAVRALGGLYYIKARFITCRRFPQIKIRVVMTPLLNLFHYYPIYQPMYIQMVAKHILAIN